MKEIIKEIDKDFEAAVYMAAGLPVPEDGKNMVPGTAWYPIFFKDGEVGLIADGVCQGVAVPDGSANYIAEESEDGSIFGKEGTILTAEQVVKIVKEIVLSPENIQEATVNLAGAELGQFIGQVVVSHMV